MTQFVSLLLSTVLACSPALVPTSVPPSPTNQLSGDRQVSLPGKGAERYETTPTEGAVQGDPATSRIADILVSVAKSHGFALQGDGRLADFSLWLLGLADEQGNLPSGPVLDTAIRHFGLVESVPVIMLLSEAVEPQAEQSFDKSLARAPSNIPYNRFGMASMTRWGQRLTIAAISSVQLDLLPVPRQLSPGEPLRLEGKLLDGYRELELVVTGPDGKHTRSSQSISAGNQFSIPVKLEASGRHRVELLAEGPTGLTVVANFPVFSGVLPPTVVALGPVLSGADATPEAARSELLQRVNGSRKEAGLGALQSHDGLAQVAEAHCRDMVTNRFFGHVSPTEGDLSLRAKKAGYVFPVLAENVGIGASPLEVHQLWLESPGHRANILHPKVTHVGLGVVMMDRTGGKDFVVTQVFAQMTGPIDIEKGSAALLDLVNRDRLKQGSRPLKLDPTLTQVAKNGASLYFSDPSRKAKQIGEVLSSEMDKHMKSPPKGLKGLHSIQASLMVTGDVESANRFQPSQDPRAQWIGIGLAQGTRPDTPPNALAVVIIVGWPEARR